MRKHILWKSNPRNYFLQSQVYILLSCCVVVVFFFLYRRTRFDPLWNQVVVGGVHNGER